MYTKGDTVVYGSMGVCTVVDITTPEITGARESYVLTPRHVPDSTIYAPVEGNPVKMRAPLTAHEAEDLIDSMPGIEPFDQKSNRTEQEGLYRGALRSADCFTVAKLLKTLHTKRLAAVPQRRSLSTTEKELYNNAERMLFGELAEALGINLDEVQPYIDRRLGTHVEAAAS